MTSRIDALRNRLKADKEKTNQGSSPSKFFKFWDVEIGESSKFRFLEDKNEDNPHYYYIEEMMYEWTFDDPDNAGKKITIRMPCRNMYTPASCSVWATISALFDEDENTARSLWVKRNYLAQGFVRETDLVEEPAPEKKIRYVTMSRKLKDIQANKISDTNEDTMLPSPDPIDHENGVDFLFKKTKATSGYNDYTSSGFVNRSSALTQEEKDAIEEEGLINLRDLLPKEPDAEAWLVQEQMLAAYLNGDPWNSEWEVHFRPYKEASSSNNADESNNAADKPAAKMAEDLPVKDEVPEPVVSKEETVKETSSSKPSPQDMLAKIKARAK